MKCRKLQHSNPFGHLVLKYNSIGTDLSSPDIEGCIITFQERKAMNLKLTIKDNGTCSTVLGGACASEINRRLRNVRFADLGPEYCKQLSEAIGSSLEEKNGQCTAIGWGGLQTESISPSQQPCTQTGYLLSNHRSSAASLNPKAPEDDFSLYDEAVGIPLPLVIALWETTGTETEDISSRIMDPKVMCMGVKVLEGSRQARIALEDDEKDDGNGDDEDMDGIAGRVDGGFQMALFAGWR